MFRALKLFPHPKMIPSRKPTRRLVCSPPQRTPTWLNLLETWGEHLLLHRKAYLMLRTTQGSLSHGLPHHIPYLFSFLITSHLRSQNDDRDDKSQLSKAHRPIPSKGGGAKQLSNIDIQMSLRREDESPGKSLHKCRQLTVNASPAFLSKNVTCSEPGTIRSYRMSSPADWWKWLTLGCHLENQLFTSTRQLPPTHQAAAGHGKGGCCGLLLTCTIHFSGRGAQR